MPAILIQATPLGMGYVETALGGWLPASLDHLSQHVLMSHPCYHSSMVSSEVNRKSRVLLDLDAATLPPLSIYVSHARLFSSSYLPRKDS